MSWSHISIPLDTKNIYLSINPLPFGRLLIHPKSSNWNYDYDITNRLITLNDIYIIDINDCICYYTVDTFLYITQKYVI